ncbi:hypothetical protein MMB17_04945 [Methylobacterium organophilum]|uniref:hypothetical protein n=1 Tax=Methylobacterium organophilum TaxID=410 RepID=UPI001F13AF0B|nr:hypothetical protein [Methylobacterium organophilum]UMY18677.1 hypothetical protein MMB17_04945 [Methylobacterium organophilum]
MSSIYTSPHKQRFEMCGCHKAAIVLDQLLYWWKKGTRVVHGQEWRAKPRGQLGEEIGFTDKELRGALEKLKAKGLVETSQHRFGRDRDAVMRYRLLPRAEALLGSYRAPKNTEEAAPSRMAPKGQPLDHRSLMDTSTFSEGDKSPSTKIEAKPEVGDLHFSGKEPSSKIEEIRITKKGNSLVQASKKISPKAPSKFSMAEKKGMTAAEMLAIKSTTGLFPGTKAINWQDPARR